VKTHDECAFEETIADHLVTHGGYTLGSPDTYDAERALIPTDLFAYIAATQEKTWSRLHDLHGDKLEALLLTAWAKAVAKCGVLDVLRALSCQRGQRERRGALGAKRSPRRGPPTGRATSCYV